MTYILVFDPVILKQLKNAARNIQIKNILTRLLDKLEVAGPYAGELLDVKLSLYELKSKCPPVRIYYKYRRDREEIYVLEYEMKTNEKKQKRTINKLRKKMSEA